MWTQITYASPNPDAGAANLLIKEAPDSDELQYTVECFYNAVKYIKILQ